MLNTPPRVFGAQRAAQDDLVGLDALLAGNRAWRTEAVSNDPSYFLRLQNIQTPDFLWIGCSDSRVPANMVIGRQPGEVFVHRNVGNQASHLDLNCMSCLEYAVKELRVKHIILCGHYNCGAVKAALRLPSSTPGLVNCWIGDIRMCRNESAEQLRHLSLEDQVSKLCELNVLRQTFHVCSSPVVQAAWDAGQQLTVYGVIYSLKDGKLASLAGPLTGLQDLDIDSRGVWVRDIKADMKALPPPPPVLQSKAEVPPSSPGSVLAAQQALNTEALSSKLAQHTAWAGDGPDSHPFSVSPGSASPPQRSSTALELLSLAAVQLKGAAAKTLTQDRLDLVSRGAGEQQDGSAGWRGSPALDPHALSGAE